MQRVSVRERVKWEQGALQALEKKIAPLLQGPCLELHRSSTLSVPTAASAAPSCTC